MVKKRQLIATTVTLTPLPSLPFDLVPEILCRLPVKLLLQFRCVCKSWKSLISNPKFAKKHLHMSKASIDRHHIILYTNLIRNSPNLFPWNFQISSLFSAVVSKSSVGVTQTQLSFPDLPSNNELYPILKVCSCDGVICFTVNNRLLLWNPSIRKFNMFPPLKHSGRGRRNPRSLYGIGYDRFTQTYKIVAVSFFKDDTNQIRLYTLGTDSWRRIEDLPYSCYISKPGVFANGTINWLGEDARSSVVISLDFEKESYQKLLRPNVEANRWTLGVLKDCLCIFAHTDMFVDVWIMNECGNNQPWTKLYRVPYMVDRGHHPYGTILYTTEDEQVLMHFHHDSVHTILVVYDSKSDTYNMPELQNIDY